MTDTLFADVAEFQDDVSDAYPYRGISIRSSDGTYRDHHFQSNIAYTKHRCDLGKFDFFLTYFVWENDPTDDLNTMISCVGVPHPKMALMIDVESWAGRYSGDHSVSINAERERAISWLGGNRKRVIGYGNAGDLNGLWPTRGDANVILANYGSNPDFPGKIAHQFADNYVVPPFGPCDINSADGYSSLQFAGALGLTTTPPPPAPPTPPSTQPGDRLVVGKVASLPRGKSLTSADGSHSLHMQADGNLVIYHGTKAIWSQGSGQGVSLNLQGDGNVVLYTQSNKAVWTPGTMGKGGTQLVIQNDGNLVLYAPDGKAVWATMTNGR